jgi:hypothetical protein
MGEVLFFVFEKSAFSRDTVTINFVMGIHQLLKSPKLKSKTMRMVKGLSSTSLPTQFKKKERKGENFTR